jgi:hypothetical protein
MLLRHREYSHDALDGFRGINSVQRGENEMPGLGRFERDFPYYGDYARLAFGP